MQDGGIRSARRFRMSVGSGIRRYRLHWDEKTLILMKCYRINGIDLAESQLEHNSYLTT